MADPAYVNGFVEGHDLVLLYRNERGEMMARRRRAEWSSFYRRVDLSAEVLRDLRSSAFVTGVAEEGEWMRVRWQAPEWRRKAHDPDGWFAKLGIKHYEADVSPVRRFFSDTGANVAKPRRVYLDIETDSRVPPAVARQGKARVLCWTLVDDDVREVARGMLEHETDEDEVRILEELWRALEPYDQVIAWFGEIFDFPIIKLRSDNLGARCKPFARWLFMDFAPVYERMNRNAAESGDEKESLALNAVCQARLGEGKHDFDATKTYEVWASGPEGKRRVADYCAQDTKLLPKLNRKTGFLDTNDAICAVGRLFADTHSADPTNYVDGFMLRMAVERGTHFPSKAPYGKEEQDKHEKFKGAYVMEPKAKGIERDIHVCDFSGMYPSIILTWNMSPETIAPNVNVNGPIADGHCRSPSTRIGFALAPAGILPEALKQIRAMRKHWQKKEAALPAGTPEWSEAHRMSIAYKVIANSFYGVVGSPFSRFFERKIAESVTQNGVWLIQMTIHEAEKRGMEAIYTDTDSVFVRGVTREAFDDFVQWCNRELYPEALKKCGCVENHIEIAYEKEFARLVMCGAKTYTAVYRHFKWSATCSCVTEKGSPGSIDVRKMTCRDCGKKHESLPPPRGKPEIRGLAYKRGDAAMLARRLQWDVIQKLMRDHCDDPKAFEPIVAKYRDHLLKDELSLDEVKLSKSLSKSLKEYAVKTKKDGTAQALPPHVQIAHILKERGEQVGEGTRIPYFVTDASVTPMKVAPAVDYKGECDRFYIWEQQVWPATERLLVAAFPTADWRAWGKVRPSKRAAKAAAAGQLQVAWDQPRIVVKGQELVRLERGKARNPGSQAVLFDAASDEK